MLVIFGRSFFTVFSYYGSRSKYLFYQKIFVGYGLSFLAVVMMIVFSFRLYFVTMDIDLTILSIKRSS
jgi:hypothetical protein